MTGGRAHRARPKTGNAGRLLVWAAVLTFALLTGAGVMTFIAYQQTSVQLALERDQELAFYSATRLATELDKLAESLIGLSRVAALSEGGFSGQREALQDARNRLAVYDAGVVLMSSRGIVVATEPWRPDILGRDWSDHPHFSRLLASPRVFYSDAVAMGPEGREVVIVSVPILGSNGEFAGVLAGMFGLGEPTVSSLYASIVRLRLPLAGSAHLIDGNGQLIYDTDVKAIGGTLDEVGLARVVGSGPGAARARNADGHEVVVAHAPIPKTDWTLVLEEDWDLLTASSRRYASMLVGLLGSAALLPTLAVVVLWRQRNAQLLERELAEQELHLAHMMQSALLPKFTPMLPGWMLAAYHQPAESDCHEFYDLLLMPDGQLMMVMAEIRPSGPAVTTAMTMARSALRLAARSGATPAEALESANAALIPEMSEDRNCCCVFALLDPLSGQLSYATAGFNAPYLLGQSDGTAVPTTTPLGESPASGYETQTQRLEPGGYAVLYGRGWVMATDQLEERSGEDHLQELLRRLPEECDDPSQTFSTHLREYLGYPSHLQQDLTLIVLRRQTAAS